MKATSLNLSFCPCLLNLVLFLYIFITLALSFNVKFDAVTPGVFQFYMELIRVLDKKCSLNKLKVIEASWSGLLEVRVWD